MNKKIKICTVATIEKTVYCEFVLLESTFYKDPLYVLVSVVCGKTMSHRVDIIGL